MRSLFLYGVASHILADTFAHSAYCRCNGSLIKISDYHVKGQEDNVSVHPDRFTDAKEAMYRVLLACQSQKLGTELDFAPIRLNEKRGYCLKKIIEYATKAKTKYSDKQINDTYKAINC